MCGACSSRHPYSLLTSICVVQVFEGIQRVATILLHMQTSGNVLFRDWQAEVQCRPRQQPSIQITFLSLGGRQMLYHGEVTEQLQKLAHAMESCQSEWRCFIGLMRSKFSLLNLYTSEQMVSLCHWIHRVCHHQASVPQQLWHLLSPVKPHCSLADIRAAFSRANVTVRPREEEDVESDDEDERGNGSVDVTAASTEEVHDLMEFSSEDEGSDASKVDDTRKRNDDTLETLWRQFKRDMPHYLTEHLDISALGRFLSCLSDMNQQHMIRNLPPVLQEGKPNLVLCPRAEVFTTVLSFYMKSPEQPLPSNDEVLVCREETSEEEVEIFLRRALGQNCQKIYSLVSPGLLGYDVSVALGDTFEVLERSANPHYRLVIVSPLAQQHRYVPSFFSSDKVQVGETLTAETARKYLRHHFTQHTCSADSVALVSPAQLSVWMVSSVRPAVGKNRPRCKTNGTKTGSEQIHCFLSAGKSLYVDRLFEKFRQKCPRAEHIRIRLIEPSVDVDSLVTNLSEKLAPVREQDPVLLHIDAAGVSIQARTSAHTWCIGACPPHCLLPGWWRFGGAPVPLVSFGLCERQPRPVMEKKCSTRDHS